MLRFLRRYNKGILVVGGVLLLVAWAVSDSLSRISAASAAASTAWAVMDGRTISAADRQSAQGDMKLLQALGPLMSAFGRPVLPIPGADRDPVHYFLLRHEAERAGLVGPAAEGQRFLEEMLAAFPAEGRPDVDQFLVSLQIQSGLNRTAALEGLARVEGIWRLVSLYDSAPRLSDRRMKAAASRLMASVDSDIVVLDARRLARRLDWTPDEADLEAQLARYGDALPSAGSPFGYRLPNRVRLEWIVVPAAAVRGSLDRSEQLSNIELRKHRERHLAIFPRPLDGSDDFEFIRDAVRLHRLNELYEAKIAEIIKFAGDQLQHPLRGLPRDGFYVKLPEDWESKKPSLEQLAQAIAQQFGITLPSYQTSGPDLIEPARVATLDGIGRASSDRFGTTPVTAAQLVAQARELGGSDTIPIQQGVAGPPLRTPGGDVVIFRLLDVDPARAPRSVDEARARLVEDVKAQEQFRRLVAEQESLKARASRDGLAALAAANDSNVRAANDLREIGGGFIPGIGAVPGAVKGIVDFALALPRGQNGEELESVLSLPESARTFTQPIDDRLMLIVGRIVGVEPLTSDDFASIAAMGLVDRAIRQEETATLRDELFGRAAMVERYGFRLIGEDALDEEPEELVAG
ncbi:MAG TPA: hypothetical protein PKC43_03590 [Phycisphaerales bacterium]|nr:hypothetical protein [Phycisphaerales bacterium]HMP36510.1 hypothetical protein [Phycisphaerales bacterium]